MEKSSLLRPWNIFTNIWAGNTTKKILDIGAGTGKYSVALAEEGYDVSAVELVKHNLGLLKAKNSSVKAYQGQCVKTQTIWKWYVWCDIVIRTNVSFIY